MRNSECGVRNEKPATLGLLNSAFRTPPSAFAMVGRLGFAPSSRRLRAGTSLSKFATRSRHEDGVAPPWSCSRSKRLTFRLRSERLPSALNLMSGHYFDRARTLPADRVQLGKMVEHQGIAPCIPAWKVLADGH